MLEKKKRRIIKVSFLIGIILILAASGIFALKAKEGAKEAPPPAGPRGVPQVLPQALPGGTTQALPQDIIISPAMPVTISQCLRCHNNLDAFKNPNLIFRHEVHLGRGIRCEVCHTEFPHVPGLVVKPSMTVCYNCHGAVHSKQGRVAPAECSLCHPAGFSKTPASHTSGFKAKDHRVEAKKDSFSCLTCHKEDSCARCHTEKSVKPRDHLNIRKQISPQWKKSHGTQRDAGNCTICHNETTFCKNCHKTDVPHPTQWQEEHKLVARPMRVDCRVCHRSREECSDCHHQFKGSTLLVASNCTSCHDDYKRTLSDLIRAPKGVRSGGILVHRSHFEMTKTEPFECDECHARAGKIERGYFSADLCYSCHGRMRGGSLIAKWGGQELCYRCHLTRK